MNIAVAGGTGFVGGAIAAELHRRGEHVVVLSIDVEAARRRVPDGMEVRRADIADPTSSATALAGVEALVIALAFRGYPMENPRRGETFEAVDAAGTERLVKAAEGSRRFDRRLHLWGRRRARRPEALVPCQVARRGGRPRLGSALDDLPADVALRSARRRAQPLPRLRPLSPVRAGDGEWEAAARTGLHRRSRGARGAMP